MRIVFVGFARGDGRIGLLSDEADRGIINARFAFVVVLLDGAFVATLLGFLGGRLLDGHLAYLDLIREVEGDCTVGMQRKPLG